MLYIITLLVLWPMAAQAYIGPGLGLGALGVIVGFIISIILAIMAVFWYPLKRLFKGRKKLDKNIQAKEIEDEE